MVVAVSLVLQKRQPGSVGVSFCCNTPRYRYRHVVLSRFDNMWLEPHPQPLDKTGCWIPWYRGGNDWGGFNDHHALCDRRSADTYMSGRYESVVDPKLRNKLWEWYEVCGKSTYPGNLNVEKHIRYTLTRAGVPVSGTLLRYGFFLCRSHMDLHTRSGEQTTVPLSEFGLKHVCCVCVNEF